MVEEFYKNPKEVGEVIKFLKSELFLKRCKEYLQLSKENKEPLSQRVIDTKGLKYSERTRFIDSIHLYDNIDFYKPIFYKPIFKHDNKVKYLTKQCRIMLDYLFRKMSKITSKINDVKPLKK
jgi:hypothetical protein